MKVEVTQAFHDKFNTSRVYKPGEVVEFEDERAQHMVNIGIAVPILEEQKKKTRKKKSEE